ncbi:molybdenum cofactor guanylyltransferase [Paenibacillus rigui]|uniref:molybdenum cofactor guanylyltransferase n=1 Tax=Paenibacillus rigui TaxID=554312 RepID=UPI0015C5D729|nr:molybdenum cofactor guanylyltransferase [Paenibacillus rigui]
MSADAAASGLTGVVLAGGQNRRMGGRLKALLPLGGQLFIERQLEALERVCSDIVIVTMSPELFEPVLAERERKHRLEQQARVRVIPDLHPGLGPLAGMQAAMAASQSEALWIVACDMPFASAEAAGAMAELLYSDAICDAVVPRIGQRLHPLHAVYRKRCLLAVNGLLDAGTQRVMELLQRLEVAEADERFFTERGLTTEFCCNVNGQEDWSKLNP